MIDPKAAHFVRMLWPDLPARRRARLRAVAETTWTWAAVVLSCGGAAGCWYLAGYIHHQPWAWWAGGMAIVAGLTAAVMAGKARA